MNNKNNKNWWNNNPMTYLDWNLKKSDRLVTQKINFRKLNETYLQTNPYLIKKFKKIKKKKFFKK
jgi:hypothetical protein